jgi:UDP-N-acetylglucosamine diphosphorylase/glucosamine-1-phosphate N-acetyltransferase
MSQHVVVFEDSGWRRLYPITLARPSFDARIGVTTLGRRLVGQFAARDGKRVDFLCRPALRPIAEREYTGHSVNHPTGGDVLFLNGRLLALGSGLEDLLHLLDKAVAVQEHGELVGARVTGDAAPAFGKALQAALESGDPAPFPSDHSVAGAPEGIRLVRYPWDLVALNAGVLEDDFRWIDGAPLRRTPDLAPGAQILNRDHLLSREGVRVEAGAILDAGSGPIFLGDGVHIQHNAVVLGPVAIGPRTVIRVGAKIEGPVALGPSCKVGGEVEASILQGFANKQHDGFLGHSYLGVWTNLGAATNTSDLKNNYAPVRVWTPEGVKDSGSRLVGLFLGDHSKSAIGTRFNTGTVVGFSANVFGDGFPPRHVPSFSWGSEEGGAYRMDRALETARAVMARRKVEMEPADEVLFETIHRESGGFR